MRRFVGIMLLSIQCVLAQDTDSLKRLIATLPDDTNKVNALSALCEAYQDQDDNPAALKAGRDAVLLAEQLGWKKGLSRSHNNLGVTYFGLGNYPEALQHYLAALRVRNEMGHKPAIAASYNNIGIIHSCMGNFDEALKNHFASLKLKRVAGDSLNLHHSFTNIGTAYEKMGRFGEALQYHTLALEKLKQQKNEGKMAETFINMGNAYDGMKLFDQALDSYQQALRIMLKNGDKLGEAVCYLNISSLLAKEGRWKEAREHLNKTLAFSKEAAFLDLEKEAENHLWQVYEEMGDSREALQHYKQYIGLRDKIFNEENTKQLVRTEMNYEFEKKESMARAEQEKKDAVAAAEKRRQRIILFSISGLGLLVLGFAVFAYRSFLQKKKANIEIMRQKQIIEEKQKEILDSIYYARRIQRSLLPGEKYISKNIFRLKARH